MHHGHMEYFSRACGMISRNVDRITKHARAVHEGNTHAENGRTVSAPLLVKKTSTMDALNLPLATNST